MNSGSGNACQSLAALLPLTSDAQRCTSIVATICSSIVGPDEKPEEEPEEAIGSVMQAAECSSFLGSLENVFSRTSTSHAAAFPSSCSSSSSSSGQPGFSRFKLERDVRQQPHGWAPYKSRALIIAFSMLVASYFYCLAAISGCTSDTGPSSCCWTLVPTIGSCLCLLIVYRGSSPVCCQCQVLARMKQQEELDWAQRAQTAKQQFIAYVFHNIRVPFNAIVLGLGHIRASGCGDYSVGNTMDLVQLMLDSAETMTSVLDDVTDLGNWADGPLELNRDEFDLLAVVKFLVWGLKDLLEQKQISLSMDVDRVSTAVLKSHNIVSDKHRVVQTLGNFLSNAVKFSPGGGKLELIIKCEELDSSLITFEDNFVFVAARHQSIKLFVAVKDNGAGNSSFKHQQNVFEPDSFLTSPWVQSLGLNVPKRFIEQIGGNIGIHSSSEGSTFYFVAPFALIPVQKRTSSESDIYNGCGVVLQAEHHGPACEAEVAKDATDSTCKRKVLLVEDTKINRIILRKVLQKLNLQCDEAENGQVAVDLHRKGKSYDLVLMDKEMPVMDGHEATRALRKMGVKTPIVALTGNALQSDKKLFIEAGVNEFQTKPLSRDKLVQLLARYGVGSSGLRHQRKYDTFLDQ